MGSKNKNYKSIKLTFLTQFYPPDYAATGQLINDLISRLLKKRVEIAVITGSPSYAYGKYKFNKCFQKEKLIIRRIYLKKFNRSNLNKRLINGMVYSLKTLFLLNLKKYRKDLIIATSEPPFLSIFAYFFSLIYRTPYVLIIYDLYPDAIFHSNIIKKSNLLIKIWHKLNKISFKRAKAIVVLSDEMRNKIIDNYKNIEKGKIHIIPSWADIYKIKPLEKNKNSFSKLHKLNNKFVVMYSGNLGRFHDLDTIVGAVKILKNDSQIKFVFIGDGIKKQILLTIKKELNLNNLIYLPYMPVEDLKETLPAADLALISISDYANSIVAPSKLYGHLAAGNPIAFIGNKDSFIRKLIEDNKCGNCFLNGDSKALADWMIFLKNNKSKKEEYSFYSRNLAEKISDPNKIAENYLKIIESSLN